jgi:hypothetical protein
MMGRMKEGRGAALRFTWAAIALGAVYAAGFVHGAGLSGLPEWVRRLL